MVLLVSALLFHVQYAYCDEQNDKVQTKVTSPKLWSAEFFSGVSAGNVRVQENVGYTMVPIGISFSRAMDDVSLTDWRRGYTEFVGNGYYTAVVNGPESRIAGLNFGPRYNFVQESLGKFTPFIEANVGIGFADSNPSQDGLGTDFNFSFGVGTGVKYNIDDTKFIRLTATYDHYSNAGMSEPYANNNPIDSAGFKIGVGFNF